MMSSEQTSVPISKNGRMNLPAEMRRALGLKGADRLILTLVEDGVRITTRQQMLNQVRDLAAPYKPVKELASAQLIAERRRAARSENKTGKRSKAGKKDGGHG